MKSFWEREGKFNKAPGGYRVNRHLGWAALALFLLYVIFVAAYYVANPNIHVVCNRERPCENPFYERCDDLKKYTGEEYPVLCAKEYLMPGEEWGKEAPFYAGNVTGITIGFLFLLFGLNHFLYNKGGKNVFD